MNQPEKTEITVETLLALRQQENAAQLIAEKLRVKEMGPADHIRTKHEVKAFVEIGGNREAHALIKRSNERVGIGAQISTRQTLGTRQQQGL